jgi:asparagine synthase (glutamine-hydrolysing)
MCGVCGILSDAGGVDVAALESMTGALRHRGPDADGYYVSPAAGGSAVGFGIRRLAIIDVEGGNQPIANEDRTVWLVFNGEIYNFPELRRELEGKGHRFATHTDGECIVHLYEELGARCVTRLNGMFAFAIWDERRQELLLARDRFGKKPLYYAETRTGLIFGSELKSLLLHPGCPRDLDVRSLARYLAFEYVPEPHSIISGVRKLPAAHTLTWRAGRVSLERYWQLVFDPEDLRSERELVDEFRSLFFDAVRRRLLSDVPLGAFLSGGVDSSSVVAAMTSILPPEAVQTFSIGFGESSFDESRHAQTVASFFGTDHHHHVFTPSLMLDLLPEVADVLDEPFADPSVLPTYALSRFAREHVVVALGGDGGDELLAGYPTFTADKVASLYRLPRPLHERVVVPLADRLPVSTSNFSFDFKLKRFLRGVTYDPIERHAAWLGALTPPELARLLGERFHDPYRELAESYGTQPTDRVQQLIMFYVSTYLRDDILTKVDRASMACSLEVRAPFLDVELAEFLGRVPSSFKLRGFRTKYLLKKAMGDLLPPGIAARPKKGFGVPVAAWLKDGLRETLEEELHPGRIREQGLFEPSEVQRLVSEHLSGRRDNRKPLWALLVFQLWHRRYSEGAWLASEPRRPPARAHARGVGT